MVALGGAFRPQAHTAHSPRGAGTAAVLVPVRVQPGHLGCRRRVSTGAVAAVAQVSGSLHVDIGGVYLVSVVCCLRLFALAVDLLDSLFALQVSAFPAFPIWRQI